MFLPKKKCIFFSRIFWYLDINITGGHAKRDIKLLGFLLRIWQEIWTLDADWLWSARMWRDTPMFVCSQTSVLTSDKELSSNSETNCCSHTIRGSQISADYWSTSTSSFRYFPHTETKVGLQYKHMGECGCRMICKKLFFISLQVHVSPLDNICQISTSARSLNVI